MKRVNKDPFSNGTEYMLFEERCCNKCLKHSKYNEKTDEYTQIKCSIERDILERMYNNEPINQRTIDICNDFILHGKLCPYMKTERKKVDKTKNLPKLFEI